MGDVIVEIPHELEQRIKAFPDVDWKEVERRAIEAKLFELEVKRSKRLSLLLLKTITSKSKLSEEEADAFAIALGRRMKVGRLKQLKSMGLI